MGRSLESLCYLKTLFIFCTSSAEYVCQLSDSLNTSDEIGININIFSAILKWWHNSSGSMECEALGLPAVCHCFRN